MTCLNCGVEIAPPRRRYCSTVCKDTAWRKANPGASTEAVRRYRSDPSNRELDRERSRRWKREHLGQPGLPARKDEAA